MAGLLLGAVWLAVLCAESPAQELATHPAATSAQAATAPAEAESSPATSAPAAPALPRSQRPETIERYAQYYLDLYGGHLKSPDWMARAMGIISLARLDDPRATEKLLKTMRDGAPIVRVYAWEALHGRQTRLEANQRKEWVRTAFELFDKDLFRGELRPSIVSLIEEGGPTELNRNRFWRLFQTTNSIDSTDIRTLWAMGDTLARWHDPELAKKLIEAMSNLQEAYRAEVILSRIGAGIPNSRTMYLESSDFMWGTTQRRWADWFLKAKWKAVAPKDAQPYTGLSRIMPSGEVIRDTADPQWTKDLELKRFRLDQLEVGIALDTTATMAAPLEWVKRDVVKMLRLFELVSREPRIGVTLFRDYGDQYITKSLPLTDNAAALAAALKNETYRGGGDIPEASFEALYELVHRQRWSGSSRAKKVIILLSDAPPHERSLKDLEELTTSAAKKGFVFYPVKVATSQWIQRALRLPNYDPQLTTFDKIAQWGNGKSVSVEFWNQSTSGRWQGVSRPLDPEHSPRVIYRDVLRFVLEEGYRDRVDPFVNILVEYIEDPLREVRVAFAKATPGGRGGRPSDPQAVR